MKLVLKNVINPLPHTPILGSSNSAANEDNYGVKICTYGDTII